MLSFDAGLRTGAIFWRAATKAAAALRVVAVLVTAAGVVGAALVTVPRVAPTSTFAASLALGATALGITSLGATTLAVSDFAETVEVLRAAGAVVLAAALTGDVLVVTGARVCGAFVLGVCVLDAFVVIFFSSVAVLGLACVAALFTDAGVGRGGDDFTLFSGVLAAFFAIFVVSIEGIVLVEAGFVAALTWVFAKAVFAVDVFVTGFVTGLVDLLVPPVLTFEVTFFEVTAFEATAFEAKVSRLFCLAGRFAETVLRGIGGALPV